MAKNHLKMITKSFWIGVTVAVIVFVVRFVFFGETDLSLPISLGIASFFINLILFENGWNK